MGIRDYFKNKTPSRVERFAALAEGASNAEKRRLERSLLKPDTLTPFAGDDPAQSSLENRTVKIVLPTDGSMELFKQFFKVSSYKGHNTRNIDIIVALLEALDRGTIRYDQASKTLNFVDDQGTEYPL